FAGFSDGLFAATRMRNAPANRLPHALIPVLPPFQIVAQKGELFAVAAAVDADKQMVGEGEAFAAGEAAVLRLREQTAGLAAFEHRFFLY
ncbi:hypothetical protein HMPREF9120_01025, partial [Neisseria sp. oral taxon 020 str. F0370]